MEHRNVENASALQSAIENLYRIFSIYPQPGYTNPCLHCHTLEDDAKLRSAPLRQLGAAELDEYAHDALSTWGDVSDFKHFLPRILDLYFDSNRPQFPYLDPEILFSKFRYGKWLAWPMQEETAIRELFHALWREILGNPPPAISYTNIQCWLCSIAQAEDNLEPYFIDWTNDSRISASFALSGMLLSGAGRNPFWDGREPQYEQFQQWLKSKTVETKLRNALEQAEGKSEKQEFEAALAIIDNKVS